VDKYDCFLVLTAGRFFENDAWLGQQIQQRKKGIYYVRTKISVDVASDKHEKRKDHKEDEVLSRIRESTVAHLRSLNIEAEVFLIDNHYRTKYDFDDLEEAIIRDLPALKRRALILSLSAHSARMIKGKMKQRCALM